jgi:hypothetical protein
MNSDQHYEHIRQRAIETFVQQYGIEQVIEGLAEYCENQAVIATGQRAEHWHDVAEALRQIIET